MKADRLQSMPNWPVRMTSDVASLFMCLSESAFLQRYRALGYKEGGNTFWAREVLEREVAKQAGIGAPSQGWRV